MNLRPSHLLYNYLHIVQFDLHKAMMEHKLNHLSGSVKGKWLDIGAGDQPYRKYFAKADAYLTTNTKRHYSENEQQKLNNLTTYWIEDGKHLPLADNSVDGVACFQVLSVIDKPEEFFCEINRVLKPGGKLVLTTDFLYPVWSSEDRLRHTGFDLIQLCESSGLANAEVESFGGFGSMMYANFMRYMRSFPEIWKSKGLFAKAVTSVLYLLLLVLLPLASLKGLIIYWIEKNNTGNTAFTFNLLLTAEKTAI